MQFHTECAVLTIICSVVMKKQCDSKAYYLVPSGYKKVNSNKNDGFKYEMMGETQPDMERLEVVTFIYPFSLKAVS